MDLIGIVARRNIGAQGSKTMTTQKNTKAMAIEKPFLSVAEVFGKFPKITCDVMRANDLSSYSAIVGALAKDNRASIDIPLALNPSGKELFNIGKITRVFYAVSQFYDSKVKIDIVENTGLNGDAYFAIHFARFMQNPASFGKIQNLNQPVFGLCSTRSRSVFDQISVGVRPSFGSTFDQISVDIIRIKRRINNKNK